LLLVAEKKHGGYAKTGMNGKLKYPVEIKAMAVHTVLV
jgi:hypothetical protein